MAKRPRRKRQADRCNAAGVAVPRNVPDAALPHSTARAKGAGKDESATATKSGVKAGAARAWRLGWAAFLTFCSITGLVAFWPRLSVSMISDADQVHWRYVVNNGSFFAVTDVIGECAVVSMPVGWQGGPWALRDVDAFAPQMRGVIRPEDSHTFNCPSYVVENPSLTMRGKVDIHLTYRYAYLFKAKVRACYELESNADKTRTWVRQACP